MRRLVIVDRISEGTAVLELEDRSFARVPAELLPPGTREGDCLWEEAGVYRFDPVRTARRREQNRLLFERLKKKKP